MPLQFDNPRFSACFRGGLHFSTTIFFLLQLPASAYQRVACCRAFFSIIFLFLFSTPPSSLRMLLWAEERSLSCIKRKKGFIFSLLSLLTLFFGVGCSIPGLGGVIFFFLDSRWCARGIFHLVFFLFPLLPLSHFRVGGRALGAGNYFVFIFRFCAAFFDCSEVTAIPKNKS